jgi:hypothetical protein
MSSINAIHAMATKLLIVLLVMARGSKNVSVAMAKSGTKVVLHARARVNTLVQHVKAKRR